MNRIVIDHTPADEFETASNPNGRGVVRFDGPRSAFAYSGDDKGLAELFGWLTAVHRGAVNTVRQFGIDLDLVQSDADLSIEAKQRKSQEAAAKYLRVIGQQQLKLNRLDNDVSAVESELSAVEPTEKVGPAVTMIDLALAAHLKAMNPDERGIVSAEMIEGRHARLRDVVLRLPTELTGVSIERAAAITAAAIAERHPERAEAVTRLRECVGYTQSALRTAFETVAPYAGGSASDVAMATGEGFDKLMRERPAMIALLSRRMANEADGNLATQ